MPYIAPISQIISVLPSMYQMKISKVLMYNLDCTYMDVEFICICEFFT